MRDKKNKILIICPSMWPKMNSWGETQRMYYLANCLAQHGWEVYTVSPKFEEKEEESKREKKYTCYFLGDGRRLMAPEIKKNNKFYELFRRTIAKILTPIISWVYNEPDCREGIYKQLWIWRYKKKICDLIDDIGIDTVIISMPAFVLIKLGRDIYKKNSGVRIIYDYRDPWHLWNQKKNLAYYTEKKFFRYADKIVGFSDTFLKDMIHIMGVSANKMATVYNGYSERDWRDTEGKKTYRKWEKRNKLCLVFTGNIILLDRKDNYRNPYNLIEIVNKIPEVELFFIGVKEQRENRIENNVHYIGNVSQEESFEYMRMSDVLISIHDTRDASGKYIVSGKFYDYMRSGKIIWHIGAEHDLMTKLIQKYKLGVWCRNEKSELEKTLEKILQYWKKDTLRQLRICDIEEISIFSRENQNKKYIDILGGN